MILAIERTLLPMAEPFQAEIGLINYILDLIQRAGPTTVALAFLIAMVNGWIPTPWTKNTEAIVAMTKSIEAHDTTTKAQVNLLIRTINYVVCKNTAAANEQWHCDERYMTGNDGR